MANYYNRLQKKSKKGPFLHENAKFSQQNQNDKMKAKKGEFIVICKFGITDFYGLMVQLPMSLSSLCGNFL